MNTTVDSSDAPALSGSNLNLSVNVSGLTKKNSAHNIGIPLPLGLIPQKPAAVSYTTFKFWSKISYYIPITKCEFQTSSVGDADNYQTTRTHVGVLEETRNRKRAAYDEALNAWSDFKNKAVRWTDISNKINRTEEEKAIKAEVFNPEFLVLINNSYTNSSF